MNGFMFERMITLANEAKQNAYCPYSNFQVGACIVSDNQFYSGCNVENASYRATLCAEATAIGNMLSCGHTHIDHILVTTSSDELCAPCGICRQMIHEFASPKTQIHLCVGTDIRQTLSMKDLLPLAFDKASLAF